MILLTQEEILSIVHKLGIQFEDKGRYIKFKCVNESHTDKNPSMTMLKENGYCRCWSCGATYNFYAFVTKLSNGDYKKYIKDEKVVERLFNQTLQQNQVHSKRNEPERNMRILHGHLKNPKRNTDVLQYLQSLSVTEEMINYFSIAYVNTAAIAFDDSYTGTFIKDRICVPIVEKENIVNMECRDFTLQQKLKVIYPKGSKADVLWNYDSINKEEPVYVVEGIKSAFRIWRYVSKNVVATLGSALGANQKELLSEMKKLVLFPDNDDAGRSMITQVNTFYDHDYSIIFMPNINQDPSDGTLEDLQYAISNPIESVDWRLSRYGFYTDVIHKKISWI